ncbi:MAG: peptide-methionine (S)-S-oxide reductase MsrA [Rhodobacteraceae bacterium]|nr:peptide-methionine (S)-S-oxide reductase MsrA [Paracoccaceae bacterium]
MILRERFCATVLGISALLMPVMMHAETETLLVAGGCFWCVESDFDTVDGVVGTTSGFTGGHVENPSYREVTGKRTGHYEAVLIEYDPAVVTYRELLDLFFRSIDPTDPNGQFCDRGPPYRTGVFVENDDQRRIAIAARSDAQDELGRRIVTKVLNADEFWPAPDKHQDYHLGTNSILTRFGILTQADAYKRYRKACGRDQRVQELWGESAPFAHMH